MSPCVSNSLRRTKNEKNNCYYNSNMHRSTFIIGAGEFVVDSTNYIGDVFGTVAGTINSGLQPIKDTVSQGAKKLWNWINPFD